MLYYSISNHVSSLETQVIKSAVFARAEGIFSARRNTVFTTQIPYSQHNTIQIKPIEIKKKKNSPREYSSKCIEKTLKLR